MKIEEFVEQYRDATDLERPLMEDTHKYDTASATGKVKDAVVWDTFDERSDKAGRYYKVITDMQKTKDGIPYEILIFYKDKAKIEALRKGEEISIRGVFIKIVDETGYFSAWVYAEQLTDEDKVLLGV
jgi:hypothetical protein